MACSSEATVFYVIGHNSETPANINWIENTRALSSQALKAMLELTEIKRELETLSQRLDKAQDYL